MIEAITRGIPVDIAIMLRKATITVIVNNAVFITSADVFFVFSMRSDNRCGITSKEKIILMNQLLFNQDIQEILLIDFKEGNVMLIIQKKSSLFRLKKKLGNGCFFNESSFLPF